MKKAVLNLSLLILSLTANSQERIITDEDEQKAKEIVSKMTLEEKISYISGYTDFSIRPIPRLGLPEVTLADGPQGIRNTEHSTLYPCGILSASTWNRKLIWKLGQSLGKDAKLHGIDILLGPGVNIYRSPMCGRNFEYFGEDPYLVGETAKQYILGVQSEDVIATVKHFALNNQEWDRHNVSSDADERTIGEIYFPAFRKAVRDAHVGAVMNSYNLINGVHATENAWLNIDVLRHQWGFKGILMSDWNSLYSGVMAALYGPDLEMPSGKFMNAETLLPAIRQGILPEQAIDRKVQHILQTLIAFGKLDPDRHKDMNNDTELASSKSTALELAREGIVLLKNEDAVLPLKGTVAVMGPNAEKVPTGGGSGFVNPFSAVSVADGMGAVFGKKSRVIHDDVWLKDIDLSFRASYFDNRNFQGIPVEVRTEQHIDYQWGLKAPFENMPSDNFSARWEAEYTAQDTEDIILHVEGDDGYRVSINGKEVASDWNDHGVTSREMVYSVKKGERYHIKIDYYDNAQDATIRFYMKVFDSSRLENLLKKVDNVVLCVGFDSGSEGEGWDRPFSLNERQISLIDTVASLKKNVIVVVNAGGGIAFKPWIDRVKGVLMAWYPGQEGGKAVAEILSGKISPSGKLPISIEEKWEDNPVHDSYYDNRDVSHKRVLYSEGLFVGYRGYERSQVKPLFPFGYGLSYTDFHYSNLQMEQLGDHRVRLTFDVKNTGKVDASEVAQVYVHEAASKVMRPVKELKGYEKIFLKRGETKRVSVELDADAFSYYDVDKHRFVADNGMFTIMVGSSSENILLTADIRL